SAPSKSNVTPVFQTCSIPLHSITLCQNGCSIPAAKKKEHPMKKLCLLALFSGVLLSASFNHAQTATGETLMLDLPRQSQHAVIMQRIGITDITVNYHRPLSK